MSFFLFIPYYLLWHYGLALKDIKNIWFSFIAFVYKFFSIPILLSTLFSPWERIHDSSRGTIFESIIFNTLMRAVGVFVRLFFIFIGLLGIVSVFIFGIFFYVIWFFAPFMILNIAIWGINQFFL